MYETQVTVVGNLLTDVDNHRLNDGTVVANFRIASKERRFDQASGSWVDGDRLYIDVRCWRGLAQNALESLKKGDPVVVAGRIFTRNYEHQGQRRTSTTLEARSVAADLAHCTVVLTRTRRGAVDAYPGHDDRTVAETVDVREVDDSGWEQDGDVPGAGGGPQGERRPDGSRPQLVGAAPGDEA
jgi:single-strand DNA-binding protein